MKFPGSFSWRKSYHLFLLTAVVSIIIIAADANKSYDFHIHETYFVVGKIHIALGIGLPFLFTWLIYMMSEKILLSTYLTWVHFVTTVVALSGFIILFRYSPTDLPMPQRYDLYETPVNTTPYVFLVYAFFILGQCAFLINVFGGLMLKLIKPSPPPFIENI